MIGNAEVFFAPKVSTAKSAPKTQKNSSSNINNNDNNSNSYHDNNNNNKNSSSNINKNNNNNKSCVRKCLLLRVTSCVRKVLILLTSTGSTSPKGMGLSLGSYPLSSPVRKSKMSFCVTPSGNSDRDEEDAVTKRDNLRKTISRSSASVFRKRGADLTELPLAVAFFEGEG